MNFDFSTLVTDRNQADLDTLRSLMAVPLAEWTTEQLEEFNRAVSRGTYNYRDLNRVTACMDYLNEVLTGLGYETGYQRIAVPHQDAGGRLPSGYTELQYIESTGTQWIDTEFKPDQYTRVSLEFQATSNPSNDWILGVRKSTNVDSYGAMAGSATSITSWFGTASVTKTVSPITNRFNFDKNKAETTISYDDGESVIIYNSPSEFKSEYNLFLLNINLANSPANAAISGRLYSCKIYSDGQLVRDFIPCINPDVEIGIYDAANGQFYGNSGTGAFIPGPEVLLPPKTPMNFSNPLSVALVWDAVSSVEYYNVYRNGALLGSTKEPFFVDTSVLDGGTYTYAVNAENLSGESGLSGEITVTVKAGYSSIIPLINYTDLQ